PERKKEYLQILVAESERISRLINQVLDIETLESDNSPLRTEPVDLCAVLRSAKGGMEQMMTERGITFSFSLPEPPLIVRADYDRMVQVVVNLLSNALKFCDPEHGKIELRLERHPHHALIVVSDNGVGIPKTMQGMIFERFTQVHSREKGKPQGTGLGLFITKNIVEKHGGQISVESEPGQGAKFEIKIPV
ncbi:MAG: HAMP domain-containing sensor histidine kinase, partial [Saprospiraceae bacterium]|nr:HAMP domain-containing sensor histidine kinase [Saprospiraceae bacterium]